MDTWKYLQLLRYTENNTLRQCTWDQGDFLRMSYKFLTLHSKNCIVTPSKCPPVPFVLNRFDLEVKTNFWRDHSANPTLQHWGPSWVVFHPLPHSKNQPSHSGSSGAISANEACSWKESLSLACWFCRAAGETTVLVPLKCAGWHWKSDWYCTCQAYTKRGHIKPSNHQKSLFLCMHSYKVPSIFNRDQTILMWSGVLES